jgi:RimJ/RimL family protein N-acetyltransferase
MTEPAWKVVPLTEAHAREITTWTYPEPYSLYDGAPDGVEWLLDPLNGYLAVVDGSDELVAFMCFGHDARVPGGTYDDKPIDFGVGMRPDLVGQGNGPTLLELVICEANRRWKRRPLRTTIASFNERSTQLVRRFRFQETEVFRNPAGREFVVFLGR